MIILFQFLVDYWFVFVPVMIFFAIRSVNYSATKHNEGVENRRVERVEIISNGGSDPVLSPKEGRKIIFYMFLALLPIFIMFFLVND